MMSIHPIKRQWNVLYVKENFQTEDEDVMKQNIHDHCPGPEKYGGTLHSLGDLQYWLPDDTPVIIHNLSKCDGYEIKKLTKW